MFFVQSWFGVFGEYWVWIWELFFDWEFGWGLDWSWVVVYGYILVVMCQCKMDVFVCVVDQIGMYWWFCFDVGVVFGLLQVGWVEFGLECYWIGFVCDNVDWFVGKGVR